MYDLISLGEVMLRLSPPRFERLRRATQLDVKVAGSQLNVAANLARLGKRTAFVSKLPDNELGYLARDMCMSYGVDMTHTRLVANTRMGINFLEFGAEPRVHVAVYDRQNSAASTIGSDEFDWENILRGARLAYTDGIFPGLSARCLQAANDYLRIAKHLGCITCFDVNYREHLWTESAARNAWSDLLKHVDIVATNRSVSERVFGFNGNERELLQCYHDAFGCRTACLTSRQSMGMLRGSWSSAALSDGSMIEGRRFEFEIVDRFGTGDAWFAGFLFGYLERGIEFGLDFGGALCALAHTIEGDVAHVSAGQVMELLEGRSDTDVRR